MSLGYAEKLSFKADVGKLGLPEVWDSSNELQSKTQLLAQLIQESKHLVVFTGAGISTSCGIPDFRGPKGIWTLQHEGKPLPKSEVAFWQARPGLTHMAIVELVEAGIIKFIISQNIDGLHLRSGVPRDRLSELHGNSFMETCRLCNKEYLRDFEMETIGVKPTGRRCSDLQCGGKLVDTIVDWEGALPPAELEAAEKHCKNADLVLCLGTSLQITPACNLPLRCVRAGGKLVIVNLQATPKDKKATLVLHGRVDEIMTGVMRLLNKTIPPFIRVDRFLISSSFSWTRKKSVKWVLRVSSPHGQRAPLHFIDSIEVSYPETPEVKPATLKAQPYVIRRETAKLRAVKVFLKIHLSGGCMCQLVEIWHPLNFEVQADKRPTWPVQGAIDLAKLRQEDAQCGRVILMDARQSPKAHDLDVEYGIVTSVISYGNEQDEDKPQTRMLVRSPPTEDKENILKRQLEDADLQSSSKRMK